ncbi:MAG: methyltransferase domain-containing protein [Candidatus Dadabacteria bacterium]|nr:methyltransferase domain-containing protein [Candidatus Dadabacteria bacterium]NIX15553.1 methyltransferase domain-containing protein [Candidatus Dadabacteria bacterium]NIY22293.1 methyltransferase domain-containing protein [Candidatus Dadabacteria bacterium]
MIQNIFSDRVISNVLDVGCGSAILSIASVALGAGGAMSIDIEPSVIGEARKNIETNDYSSKIQVQNCDIDHIKGSYDLVIANILTEQILKISKKLADRMNVNGQLILSGIRLKEKDIIIDKFTELNTVFKKSLTDGDWCSLLFSKI